MAKTEAVKRRGFLLATGVALGAGCLSSGSTDDRSTDTAETTTTETTGRPTTSPAEPTSSARTTTTTATVEPTTTSDAASAGEPTTEHSVESTDRADPSTVETTTATATDATPTERPVPTDPPEPTARWSTPGADATVSITIGEENLFRQRGHMDLKDVEPGLDSEQESPSDETLILRNYGEDPVDIAGSVLHYVDAARTYTFPDHAVPANDSITVHSGSGENQESTFYAGFDQPVLPDDPEDRGTIELIQPGNTVVFRQTYIVSEDGDGLVILQ